MNSAIANIPDPKTLFNAIYETLRPLLFFEVATIILPTADPKYAELYTAGLSVPDTLLNFDRNELETLERELGVSSFTLCPLPHGGTNVGYVMFGNGNRGKISPNDFSFLKKIAQVVGSAVASTTSYAKLEVREQEARSIVQFTTQIMDIFESEDFETSLGHLY